MAFFLAYLAMVLSKTLKIPLIQTAILSFLPASIQQSARQLRGVRPFSARNLVSMARKARLCRITARFCNLRGAHACIRCGGCLHPPTSVWCILLCHCLRTMFGGTPTTAKNGAVCTCTRAYTIRPYKYIPRGHRHRCANACARVFAYNSCLSFKSLQS